MAPVRSVHGLQETSQASLAPTTTFTDADTWGQLLRIAPHDLFDRPGWYAYVPDTGQILVIERAIQKGVARMFPLVRAIARGRLMETNKLPHTLQVIVTPDSVGTRVDTDKPMNLPRSGTTVRWEDGIGNVCRARSVVVADTLTQLCAANAGSSVAQYVLQDSGERLQKIMHITSPHLSESVDYAIRFRRYAPPLDPRPSIRRQPL